MSCPGARTLPPNHAASSGGELAGHDPRPPPYASTQPMLGVALASLPKPAARRVPARQGPVTWFNGDIYRMPLTAAETGGAIGIVEATVPPGGGPAPHVHERSDETFYV